MTSPESAIRVQVDITNPGQFFACCGLLELADRLWPGAEGWFEEEEFCIARSHGHTSKPPSLMERLTSCSITNTMTDHQLQRLRALKSKKKRELDSSEADEKKFLQNLWRVEPLVLGEPFSLRLDWFIDDYAGGSRFKTWAGQQSAIDIACAMKANVETGGRGNLKCASWLLHPSDDDSVPFNFDSNLGPQSSSIDVGFSLDALKIPSLTRPLIELGALIGLQRFRPHQVGGENLYRYRVWHQPLTVRIASVAACTLLPLLGAVDYEFSFLYRTKYLKSFLPATQVGAST